MNSKSADDKNEGPSESTASKYISGMRWARKREPLIFYGMCLIALIVLYVTIGRYRGEITAGDYSTAIGTMILAIATFALVIAQRHSNYLQSRPAVVAGIETERSIDTILLVFIISNNGRGLAKNVSVRCTPNLVTESGKALSDAPPFDGTYELLGQGTTKRISLGRANTYLGDKIQNPLRYEFIVTYQDSENNQYEHKFVEDLSIHKNAVIR